MFYKVSLYTILHLPGVWKLSKSLLYAVIFSHYKDLQNLTKCDFHFTQFFSGKNQVNQEPSVINHLVLHSHLACHHQALMIISVLYYYMHPRSFFSLLKNIFFWIKLGSISQGIIWIKLFWTKHFLSSWKNYNLKSIFYIHTWYMYKDNEKHYFLLCPKNPISVS